MTRNGKIARLPLAIRQELNQRLQDGQKGRQSVAWLNGLPEVQAVMASEFRGKPIAECNLSERLRLQWEKLGFRREVSQWRARKPSAGPPERNPA
jgi:hypothetical protein